MKPKTFIFFAALSQLLGPTANARQDPKPPPSGIVIHLFGPDSVMSNVIPTTTSQPSPYTPTSTNHTAAPTTAPATSATSATSSYPEPSLHDILHQMFVTGDPNDPSKLSTGRTVNRLSD